MGLLFLFKHTQTVLVEALLKDTRAMRAEPHASCWICRSLRLAAVGCTLQWTLRAEFNKQLQLLFAYNNINANITSEW